LGITFPVALSLISRRGRKTKNNGRVVSSGYNTDKPELFTEILQKSAGFANTSFLFCGQNHF
jgi:hypothetical protein